MLIALLMQAAIAASPQAPAPSLARPIPTEQARGARCQRLITEVMREYQATRPPEGTKPERRETTRAQPPVWVPGAYPEEGYYAAVNRMLDGCPVPTPIYLPNAGAPAAKR